MSSVESERCEAPLRCRFGCENPVGIYWVPKGCVCWPDQVQALCMQHFVKCESEGPVRLLLELSPPQEARDG